MDDAESVAAIHRALDLGINFIDTADVYGVGHSEEVIGRAIGKKRAEVIIATKFGVELDAQGREVGTNGTRAYVFRACEASLRRLDTDYIDLYQMHWPDEKTPLAETMGALAELKQQGKIRAIGVSNFTAPMLATSIQHAELVSFQPPYSLFNRAIEAELLPWCRAHGMAVLAYAPMAHGLLTGRYTASTQFREGDWRQRDEHFQGEKFIANLKVVERLKTLAAESGHTPAQLAIAWVLAQYDGMVALAGVRRGEQIAETVQAVDWELTPGDLQQIELAAAGAVPVLI